MGILLVILLFLSAFGCSRGCADPMAQSSADQEFQSSIDGRAAIGHIKDIISFGPRHPGTPGAEKTREYIFDTLQGFGLAPTRHDFVAWTPHPELKRVEMANISVDIAGTPGKKTVLIGGHFDGKLLSGVNFKGANDGGSSTGLLLEMARRFSKTPPPCPVRLAFFDGEEALVEWSDTDSRYGSKHMAQEIKQSGTQADYAAVIVVDMIGDARLGLTRDTFSTPWVFDLLERKAEQLGHGAIFRGPRGGIEDDHLPFAHIGIPSAVLIDLKYGPGWESNGYWHTEQDDIDKLSPASMEIVGEVVIASLHELSKL